MIFNWSKFKECISFVIRGTHFFMRCGDYGDELRLFAISNEYKGYSLNYYDGSLVLTNIKIGVGVMIGNDTNKHLGKLTLDNYREFVDIALKYSEGKNHLGDCVDLGKSAPVGIIAELPVINDVVLLKKMSAYLFDGGSITKDEHWLVTYFEDTMPF